MGRAVNPLEFSFGGSNPPLSTKPFWGNTNTNN